MVEPLSIANGKDKDVGVDPLRPRHGHEAVEHSVAVLGKQPRGHGLDSVCSCAFPHAPTTSPHILRLHTLTGFPGKS